MPAIQFQTAAVEDVLAAIRNSDFLSQLPDAQIFRRRGHVIVDSVEEFELYREPYVEGARIALEMNWNDLLGDDDIGFLEVTRAHTVDEKIEFTNRIDSIFGQFAEDLERKAVGRFGRTVGADIVTDVYNLIQTRAACGVVPASINEKRWALLRQGAWACGWSGGVDGSFAVFLGDR